MAASRQDGIWVDLKSKKEVDLDEIFDVNLICEVVLDEDEGQFYFLSNMRQGKLGFFLIRFSVSDPNKHDYLTMWRHKLDIADVNMQIFRDVDANGEPFKELIIGYKTIYINTYNLVVQDLGGALEDRATLQRHESFQLWESAIAGMCLQTTNKEYVTMSKSGLNVLALGKVEKRKLSSSDGQMKIIHSLDSLSFLKVDKINYINFKCQDYSNRIISIEQEDEHTIMANGKPETINSYREIYKVKIFEITLRELLILQSLYISSTQTDIVNLVKLQPNPTFFYKTFLELDCSNIASMLAFDSRAVQYLL